MTPLLHNGYLIPKRFKPGQIVFLSSVPYTVNKKRYEDEYGKYARQRYSQ